MWILGIEPRTLESQARYLTHVAMVGSEVRAAFGCSVFSLAPRICLGL